MNNKSKFENRESKIDISLASSVAFSHNEVQTAENGDNVAHHAAGQEFRKYAQVNERGRADFQAIGHAAPFALNVKAKFTLWIFRSEINLARRRIESFGHNNEVMNQFLHFRHH